MGRARDFGALRRLWILCAAFTFFRLLIGCGGAVNGFDNGDDGSSEDSPAASDARADGALIRDGGGSDVSSDVRLDTGADVTDGGRADTAATDAIADARRDV